MARVIAIINHKGGTTKTTATEDIADIAVQAGNSVCIIDLDTSYNATNFFLDETPKKDIIDFLNGDKKAIVKISDRFHIVPGSKKIANFDALYYAETDEYAVIKNAVDNLPYDYIIIDTPHSIGNVIANAMYAADIVIIPVMPNRDSADGSVDVIDEMNKLKKLRKDAKCVPFLLPSCVTWYSAYDRDAIKSIKAAHKNIEVLPYIPYRKSIAHDQSDRVIKRNTNVYKAYREVFKWLSI